jgi:hypothetical protein
MILTNQQEGVIQFTIDADTPQKKILSVNLLSY